MLLVIKNWNTNIHLCVGGESFFFYDEQHVMKGSSLTWCTYTQSHYITCDKYKTYYWYSYLVLKKKGVEILERLWFEKKCS